MCNTRDRKYRGMAWSLQRGKTEGTKSIVSKVIYGRRGVYQFASGRCERARLPPPSLLTTLSLSPSVFSRARPTDFSYINFSTFKNKRPLLTLFLSLSLSLRPHLIIFRLGTERERTRQALGYPRCWNSIGETTSPARKSISA